MQAVNLTGSPRFSPWVEQWVNGAVPAFVKKRFSPKPAWRDRPFDTPDAQFFSKGIRELSQFFTEDRSGRPFNYLNHERFRSSYLLYFLPLQAAKFLSLLELHSEAMGRMIEEGKQTGEIRILDAGAGPGTASQALLLWFLSKPDRLKGFTGKIRLFWVDTNAKIMEEGKALTLEFFGNLPELKDRLEIDYKVGAWQRSFTTLPDSKPFTLALFGNVFNEESVGPEMTPLLARLASPKGAGLLFVEPAFKTASQTLALLRDGFLNPETSSGSAKLSVEGPCLHEKICPMANGRDWCHFSIPASVPGKWFQFFSKALGSERHWLKFSYLWVSKISTPIKVSPDMRRVISDPLNRSGYEADLLLCEPERARKVKVRAKPQKVGPATLPSRGDLFNYVVIGQTATTGALKPEHKRKPAPLPSPKRDKTGAGIRRAMKGKPKK